MTGYHVANELISDLTDLRERFPGVDFVTEFHLLDEASWCGWEESHCAWLFHFVPTDTLVFLEDIHTVMADYEPPVWSFDHPCGLQTTTWEKWFELKEGLERTEGMG